MIICICNVISDKDIRKAIDDGASDFNEFAKKSGIGDDCGSCHKFARTFFEKYYVKQVQPRRSR